MKRQGSVVLHLLLVLALGGCAEAVPSPSPTPHATVTPTPLPTLYPTATLKPSRLPDPNDVKALLMQLVDGEKRAPGIVVGMIADDPQERWVVGYGRLSATDPRVPDDDTVFEIGSITKVFTGILLAQAVLRGEVKLDDPISLYLPEGAAAPEYEGQAITLLDLATHTSALPRMPSNFNPKDLTNPYADYTMEQMYAFLSGYRLTRAPGTVVAYSNYGFGLLGNLLVRAAAQVDYEALLLERITRPLGMDSTRIQLTEEMRARLAAPHTARLVQTSLWDIPTLAGTGAIRSTANDMLTFLAANMGMTDTELRPALQMANTAQRSTPGLSSIGLGWGLPNSGTWIHEHAGGTGGTCSYAAWDPQRKIGMVLLANADTNVYDMVPQLLRGLPKPFPVAPGVLAAYAGRYQFSDGAIVAIRVDGSRIFLQAVDGQEYEAYARSENQFYPRAFDAEFTFYRNDRGEVDRIVGVVLGEPIEAQRIP